MMPLRLGKACDQRQRLLLVDLLALLAVGDLDQLHLGEFRLACSFAFMKSIQAFWLVAVGVEDRIANSPS